MTVRIHPSFNLSPRDGVECMNELKVRLHNLNSPFMQNRDGKMRSGGVEYIILEKAEGEAEIFTSREFGSVCVEAKRNLNGLWYDWTTRFT